VSPSPEVRIGERLRFYRQAKGKTQAVVAGLAGVTEDYLSQIERGLKTPTILLLHRFSKILGVRVSELLGESATEHDETVHPVGYAVQRALMSYPGVDGSPDLAGLRGRVDAAWSTWQGSQHRFTEISEVLPGLVTDVQAAQRGLGTSASSDERREAQRISTDLYFLLRTFTKRIGRTDLSLLVADRGVLAAEAADDPVRMAAAKWNLGHILLAQGQPDGAEDVAIRAVEDLERDTADGDLGAKAIAGALWLVAVVAAVRNNDPWTARDRLREKAWPAARVTGDANVMWTVFGPTSVQLRAVNVEMEMGEAAEVAPLPQAGPRLHRRPPGRHRQLHRPRVAARLRQLADRLGRDRHAGHQPDGPQQDRDHQEHLRPPVRPGPGIPPPGHEPGRQPPLRPGRHQRASGLKRVKRPPGIGLPGSRANGPGSTTRRVRNQVH
jgi:transcriptional regulator with XRE-family HTH domain